jgi:hypothetical protein
MASRRHQYICQRQVTWLRVEGMNSGWPQEQRRRFQLGTRLYSPGLLPIFAFTSFQFSIQLVEIVGNSEIQRKNINPRTICLYQRTGKMYWL